MNVFLSGFVAIMTISRVAKIYKSRKSLIDYPDCVHFHLDEHDLSEFWVANVIII